MTTAQLDHLRVIDAHLASLLAIAAKRTPGVWEPYENIGFKDTDIQRIGVTPKGNGSDVVASNMIGLSMDDCRCNAAFIAACSGNAEAGWKATRAAIAGLLESAEDMNRQCGCDDTQQIYLERIIAAFPLELLTP